MNFYRKNSPVILSIFFFIILIVISFEYVTSKRITLERDVRNQTLNILISKKSNLEKALYSRVYYTRGVAAFVSLNSDISSEEFNTLVRKYIKNDSVISTMSLAPDGVINTIYPLKGHEKALGLDLINHPERYEMVQKTIITQKTFIAGPVELVEGGAAFISYTPIYKNDKKGRETFWGLTDIVIYKDRLLKEAGLKVNEENLDFALRGRDGSGSEGEIFWGDESVFSSNPVEIMVKLPSGTWILAARPTAGWSRFYNRGQLLIYILIVSCLIISALLFFVLRGLSRIKMNEQEFKAIFNSMDTLILEFDKYGNYIRIAPTNLDLLYLPEKELIGKNVYDLFEPELAKLFKTTVSECLKTKAVKVIDYSLKIRDKSHWFRARVSYHDEDRVLFNIYDITDIKTAEIELKESEKRLSELNEIKDRFFSVIAHDLRAPISSFENLTEVMLDDTQQLQVEEQRKMIDSINKTATSLGDLLENLLSWAKSQQQRLDIKAHEQSLFNVVNEVIATQEANALTKKIKLNNRVDKTLRAYFDQDLTKIILRNLISNSLKFSYSDATIDISVIDVPENYEHVWLQVRDEGIGISKAKQEKLFRLNKEQVSYGTMNEKGSGLGLILCKEFVEMQGGTIQVKSDKDKGTTIRFSIPRFRPEN